MAPEFELSLLEAPGIRTSPGYVRARGVLPDADKFDALAGSVPAARLGGPILLVRADAIPAATSAELARLKPAKIVVLGGSGVVSNAVATAAAAIAGGVP